MLNFSNSILGTVKFHVNWEPGMELDRCLILAKFSHVGHYHGIQAPKQLETSTGSQRPMQEMQPLTLDTPSHHQRAGKVSGLRGVQGTLPTLEGEALQLPYLPSTSLSSLYQPARPPLPPEEHEVFSISSSAQYLQYLSG